jgi:GNAT superfamily N-acetyltransferase
VRRVPPTTAITIRTATADDAAAVADVYLASIHATYEFPLAHTDDEVRGWIRDVLVPSGGTWVAVDAAGDVVGMMAVQPGQPGQPGEPGETGQLDQLYVRPDRLGEGIGWGLLDKARKLSPAGLNLYTFQVNARARRFYERNGFVAEWLGDGSANEERQPDVRYVWRP